MQGTRQPSNDSTSAQHWRYRLNPYHFLADRKTWVLAAIFLPLVTYGICAHFFAGALGYLGGSQNTYWVALGLIGLGPIFRHLLTPLMDGRAKSIVIARFDVVDSRWVTDLVKLPKGRKRYIDEGSDDLRDVAKRVIGDLGLDSPNKVDEIMEIWRQIPTIYRRVRDYSCQISGRDPSRENNQAIRLAVTKDAGSSYCYALAFGPMTIVIPLGATPADLSTDSLRSEEIREKGYDFVRYLLAHELSHILLRDEPLSLFADARLVSIAATVQSVAGTFVLAGASALFFSSLTNGTDSPALAKTALGTLAVVIAVWPLLRRRVWQWVRGFVPRRGPAVLLTVVLEVVVLVIVGEILALSRLTIIGNQLGGQRWSLVYLALVSSVALSQLCMLLGRRQMEFIADENAINALTDEKTERRYVQTQMSSVLSAISEALMLSPHPQPPPADAIGHGPVDRLSSFTETLLKGILSLSRESPRPPQDSISPDESKTRQQVRLRLNGVMMSPIRLFAEGILPLFRTHPTLNERKRVVEQPDLQVKQNPSVALTYATVPLVVLPYMVQELAGDGPTSRDMSSAVLAPLMLLFLGLLGIVARRPTLRQRRTHRRRQMEASLTVAIAQGGQVPSDHDATPDTSWKQAWRELRTGVVTWWTAPSAGSPSRSFFTHGDAELRETLAPNFIGEIRVALLPLGVAAVLSYFLIRIMARQHSMEIQELALPLQYITLPPLSTPGALLSVLLLSLSWYLMLKFVSLAQWHHYSGTGTLANLYFQFLNFLKASFLAGVILTVVLGLSAVIEPSVALLPAGPGLARFAKVIRSGFASSPLYSHVSAHLVAALVTLAICFAGVVRWWPSLPRFVQCPLGHRTPMTWHDVLRQPDNARDPDWGWLRCHTCGRPLAARRLLSDEDRKPTVRPSTVGLFLLTTLFLLIQMIYPILVIAGRPPTLDAIGRCRELSGLRAEGAQREAFQDCLTGPNSIPLAPEPWAPLVTIEAGHMVHSPWNALTRNQVADRLASLGDAGAAAEALKALEAGPEGEALTPISFRIPWSCGEWLTVVRNDVAFLEAIAQLEPSGKATLAECTASDLENDPLLAWKCLWLFSDPKEETTLAAKTETNASAEADAGREVVAAHARRRVAAALAFYQRIHSSLHQGAFEPCKDQHEKEWGAWHAYVERQLAPRLFFGVVKGPAPSSYFADSGHLRGEGPVATCGAALKALQTEAGQSGNWEKMAFTNAKAQMNAAGDPATYQSVCRELNHKVDDCRRREDGGGCSSERRRFERAGCGAWVAGRAFLTATKEGQCDAVLGQWRTRQCIGHADKDRFCQQLDWGVEQCIGKRASACLSESPGKEMDRYLLDAEVAVAVNDLFVNSTLETGSSEARRTQFRLIATSIAALSATQTLQIQLVVASRIAEIEMLKTRNEDLAGRASHLLGLERSLNANQKRAMETIKELNTKLSHLDEKASRDVVESVNTTFAFCLFVGQHSRKIGRSLAVQPTTDRRSEDGLMTLVKGGADSVFANPRAAVRLCDWDRFLTPRSKSKGDVKTSESTLEGADASTPMDAGEGLDAGTSAVTDASAKGATPGLDEGERAKEEVTDAASVQIRAQRDWMVLADMAEFVAWYSAHVRGVPEFVNDDFSSLSGSWGLVSHR